MRARLGLALIGLTALSACMDVEIDVTALATDRVRATTTVTMNADIYAVIASRRSAVDDLALLCGDGPPDITAGIVRCSTTLEGATLEGMLTPDGMPLLDVAPVRGTDGRIRVALPVATLAAEIARRSGTLGDPQSATITSALFAGHSLTVTVSGGTLHATNMRRDDGTATMSIPLDVLLMADPGLPRTLYATLDLPEPQ